MKPEILYKSCLQGNEKAWAHVYNYLLSYLRKIEVPDPDAQDTAQETIRYYLDRGLECIRNPQAFKKMLRMKARSLLMDQTRCQKNKRELGESRLGETGLDQFPDSLQISGGNPGEMRVFWGQAVDIVRRSLAALDAECRKILDAYFRARFLGTKLKEVAVEMALNESAFRTKAHRCQKKIMAQPEYSELLLEYRGLEDNGSG